jgi:hypothetical protein
MGKEKDQGIGLAEEKFMSKLLFVDDEAGIGNSTGIKHQATGDLPANSLETIS